MPDYQKFIIVSDLDGTLLNSHHTISQENQEAIEKFTAQGGTFTIATGRTPENSDYYTDFLPLHWPGIFYNGSVLFDFQTKKIISYEKMPSHYLYEPLLAYLEAYPQMVIHVYTPQQMYLISSPENQDHNIVREKPDFAYAKLDEIKHLDWLKVILYTSPEKLKPIGEKIMASPLATKYDLMFSADHYFEFLPKGVTKGFALRKLKSQHSADHKFIIAVGDYGNDIEMIKEADLGLAVQNALPALQAAADQVICSNNDHAIAHIIHHILPKYM